MQKIFLLSLLVTVMASCSRSLVPYTKDLRDTNDWNEQDIRRIQFYTSDDIILQRKLQGGATEIQSGKIKVLDDKEVQEIIIKKGTPGVAVLFPEGDRFGISFEIDDNHFLTFGPNPKRGEMYYLFASEWNNKVGRVTYNDISFYTSPESAEVYLVVDMKKIKDWNIDQRTVGGRKVK